VSQGLCQRSLVVTSEGIERAFLFSPHMGRNTFGAASGVDPSGHIRQLIGSMVYARNFASFRLFSPMAFLRKLIREGEAGDASSIGSDYPMLETAGIVRVEPAARYHKLVLLQSDVAEAALTFLNDDEHVGDAAFTGGVRAQRLYIPPERTRARLASRAEGPSPETQRLVAALRETMRAGPAGG
jgi:hypothetical protein